MRVGIPVAEFHSGNTSEYVLRACQQLGFQSEILDRERFAAALRSGQFDCYLCVDSGGVFDFSSQDFLGCNLSNVGYWFIDYRHHWDGVTRTPGDLVVARTLHERGGWIFQSQFQDTEHLRQNGVNNCSTVFLGADPEIWAATPEEPKEYDIGFVGNVWDRARADALQILLNQRGLRVGFFGHGALWKEDGAALLRRSRVGFNISSYYGSAHAFDVNMRVFETLSCGVPLFTNSVPGLGKIFGEAPFVRTYDSLAELLPKLAVALRDESFLSSGRAAREWILSHGTYTHRVQEMIQTLQSRKS